MVFKVYARARKQKDVGMWDEPPETTSGVLSSRKEANVQAKEYSEHYNDVKVVNFGNKKKNGVIDTNPMNKR